MKMSWVLLYFKNTVIKIMMGQKSGRVISRVAQKQWNTKVVISLKMFSKNKNQITLKKKVKVK